MAERLENFVLNENLTNDLHTFPEVQASVKDAAEGIAAAARSLAPVESGSYRDSIEVNRAQTKGGVWRVAATDQKSSWIEFGNARQEPQFIMRRAVESLGLSFKRGRS